jgi:hypothetical protein
MYRLVLLVFAVVISTQLNAQQAESLFFGQCLVEVEGHEAARQLEADMRTNPLIRVVRIDYSTQRAFVLTNPTESLTEEQFTSWFSEYSSKTRCIQVGKQGVDLVLPFPFEDCNK